MRLRDNPHIARQDRTQLLQSVAFTVGVGKTHLATALGHIAIRRRVPTLMLRADAMFKRLKASRLDNSTEAEMRRLAQVRLLLIDDFALQPDGRHRDRRLLRARRGPPPQGHRP